MHKLLPISQFTYLPAMVYPSCRSSDRVPFGTGRAQLEFLDARAQIRNTYHPETYALLKQFFNLVPNLYHLVEGLKELPEPIQNFLREQGFHLFPLRISV